MENELPLINWTGKILFFLGWREIFLIEGDSMVPTLRDGDSVLINTYARTNAGDIVLAQHPFMQSVKIVKRIREITAEGRFFLIGDNLPESTDSRSFGTLPRKYILGKVEAKIK